MIPQPCLLDGKACQICKQWVLFSGFRPCPNACDGYSHTCRKCIQQAPRQLKYEIRTASKPKPPKILKPKSVKSPPPDKPKTKEAEVKKCCRKPRSEWNRTDLSSFTPEQILQRKRANYQKYRDAYKLAHPGRSKEQRYKRRQKEQEAGTFPQKEWEELCASYGNRCLRCKEQTTLTVDHILPLSKGGTNCIDNLQPLCGICNSIKSTKVISYR